MMSFRLKDLPPSVFASLTQQLSAHGYLELRLDGVVVLTFNTVDDVLEVRVWPRDIARIVGAEKIEVIEL